MRLVCEYLSVFVYNVNVPPPGLVLGWAGLGWAGLGWLATITHGGNVLGMKEVRVDCGGLSLDIGTVMKKQYTGMATSTCASTYKRAQYHNIRPHHFNSHRRFRKIVHQN